MAMKQAVLVMSYSVKSFEEARRVISNLTVEDSNAVYLQITGGLRPIPKWEVSKILDPLVFSGYHLHLSQALGDIAYDILAMGKRIFFSVVDCDFFNLFSIEVDNPQQAGALVVRLWCKPKDALVSVYSYLFSYEEFHTLCRTLNLWVKELLPLGKFFNKDTVVDGKVSDYLIDYVLNDIVDSQTDKKRVRGYLNSLLYELPLIAGNSEKSLYDVTADLQLEMATVINLDLQIPRVGLLKI